MDKKSALSVMLSAADAYRHNLANRNLLFLSSDKHLHVSFTEVSFSEGNFKHLTGVKTTLTSKHFFSLCADRRLSESDFWFASDGTTELKLQVLPFVMKKDLSARMIGDYNGSLVRLHTEKLAGGVRACIGFDCVGKDGRYVPNTLLQADVRNLTRGRPDRILLTCCKDFGENAYSEVVFRAEGVDWAKIAIPEGCPPLPSLD